MAALSTTLSICSLSSFFEKQNKSISRGENHYRSNHVLSFAVNQGVLRGEVIASMKKTVYNVTIYLDDKNNIKSTECNCPRGAFKCSHAAALFIYGIYNVSRTDIECSWRKRPSSSNSEIQSVPEMFPPAKQFKALSRKPTELENKQLYAWLKDYGKFTGLCWLMSPELNTDSKTKLPIPAITDVIYSQEFLETRGSQQQLDFLLKKVQIGRDLAATNASLTVGQRDNPLWHQARNGRLTASNFGVVLKSKGATPSLIKRLLGEYDASKARAVVWGVNNEKKALKAFSQQTGMAVQHTGIWLHSSGILGASPDGLVGKKHLLEVKCPFSARSGTVAEAVETLKDFCLKRDGENPQCYTLRQDHVYWHQVQGQLHLTDREFCYFVVWTPKETVVLNIKKDNDWADNIDVLREFYMIHIFPKLVEGEL